MADPRLNFQASKPENVLFQGDPLFQQTTLFLGEGKFKIGRDVLFGYPFSPHFFGFHNLLVAEFPQAYIEIGDGTSLNNDVAIRALSEIIIGQNCLIGDRVTIYDADFHEIAPATRRRSPGEIKLVKIENNVWIGSQATVLKGVTIGENSVVAANSLVTKDVPANVIVGGNPARIIADIAEAR